MSIKVMSQGGQANLGNVSDNSSCSNNIEKLDQIAKSNVKDNMDVKNKKESINENEQVSKKDLDKAVQKLNEFLKDENATAKLSFHDKTSRLIVTIYDENDKPIMQIPSKKILEVVDKMSESLGVSVDKKA